MADRLMSSLEYSGLIRKASERNGRDALLFSIRFISGHPSLSRHSNFVLTHLHYNLNMIDEKWEQSQIRLGTFHHQLAHYYNHRVRGQSFRTGNHDL